VLSLVVDGLFKGLSFRCLLKIYYSFFNSHWVL